MVPSSEERKSARRQRRASDGPLPTRCDSGVRQRLSIKKKQHTMDRVHFFEYTTSFGFLSAVFMFSIWSASVWEDSFYPMLGMLYTSRVVLARALHVLVTHPSSPLVPTDPARRVPIAKEHEWILPLYMHTMIFSVAHEVLGLASGPAEYAIWAQIIHGIIAHNLFTEPLYYLLHRWLHWPAAFNQMHSYHHEHRYTDPTTGLVQDAKEHLLYMAVFGAYFIGGTILGYKFSVWYLLLHMILFDLCNSLGHFDVEWWPSWFPESPLRFVFYSPSYHAVHHREFGHYCLFSPVWDWAFGTYRHAAYRKMFDRLSATAAPTTTVVFLGHFLGPASALHTPWVSRFRGERPIAAHPSSSSWYDLVVGWCLCSLGRLAGWVPTSVCTYQLTRPSGEVYSARVTSVSLPLHPHEYTVQARDSINRLILRVTNWYHAGHMVLGACNKAAIINNCGLDLHPAMKGTTLSHGNTCTAQWCAANVRYHWHFLQAIYGSRASVLVTGASSSVGNVLVKQFLQLGCEVYFVTSSRGRFDKYKSSMGSADLHFCDLASLPSRLQTCDIWCLGVVPHPQELASCCSQATILNYTAMKVESRRHRTIDIANMRLSDKGVLRHNGRHSHGLGVGELHSCMIGGILRALEGATEHEKLHTVDDLLASVDDRLPYLGSLGLLPLKPSRTFCCAGGGDGILDHLRQAAAWFPYDVVYIELSRANGDLVILDYPHDREQLEALVSEHAARVQSWEVAGDTVHIRMSTTVECHRDSAHNTRC